MITITVETDEEERLVRKLVSAGSEMPELAVLRAQFVRIGGAGGGSAGVGGCGAGGVANVVGGGGGSGVPVARHPAYETSHVLTIADSGAVLHHPAGACAGRSPDCPFYHALAALTAEQRTMNGKWTCEVRDGVLVVLERIGD